MTHNSDLCSGKKESQSNHELTEKKHHNCTVTT